MDTVSLNFISKEIKNGESNFLKYLMIMSFANFSFVKVGNEFLKFLKSYF